MTDETTTVDEQKSTTVDMCFGDEGLEAAIADVKEKYGVDVKVLEEHGPGGGWPFVELSGTRDQLVAALKGSWDATDEELVTMYEL